MSQKFNSMQVAEMLFLDFVQSTKGDPNVHFSDALSLIFLPEVIEEKKNALFSDLSDVACEKKNFNGLSGLYVGRESKKAQFVALYAVLFDSLNIPKEKFTPLFKLRMSNPYLYIREADRSFVELNDFNMVLYLRDTSIVSEEDSVKMEKLTSSTSGINSIGVVSISDYMTLFRTAFALKEIIPELDIKLEGKEYFIKSEEIELNKISYHIDVLHDWTKEDSDEIYISDADNFIISDKILNQNILRLWRLAKT